MRKRKEDKASDSSSRAVVQRAVNKPNATSKPIVS